MRKLVVALLVLVVLVVVADRGGDFVAERVAADSIQESQGLDERPDVSIKGVPFLDQLVSGSYDEIEVSARDLPAGDTDLTISRLDVVLTDVTTSDRYATIDVADATGDARVSYDDLGSLLGIDLAYGGDGAIEATKTFTVLGQDISPTVTVRPEVTDGALAFGEPALNDVTDATGAIADALNDVFGTTVPLQGLPFDIDLDDVRVARDGVHLLLSGSDLSYARSAG